MANPRLPIQSGSNLPGLDREEEIHDAKDQDAEMEAFEDELGLDEDDAEQEVIENEDGSVSVNFMPKYQRSTREKGIVNFLNFLGC